MRHITSREHPLFKKLFKLQRSSRQRRNEGLALLDGIHLLQSYLASGRLPELLIVSESGGQHAEINQLLGSIDQDLGRADCLMLSDALFNQISLVKTPIGIMALVRIPQHTRSVDSCEDSFCIVLEAIQDPGNLGSILRSAVAAGVKDVFLSVGCADSWSPKTLRAGMGAHFSLRIHENSDLIQIACQFNGNVIATALAGADNIYHTDLRGPVMFAFGNEGCGVSEELLEVVRERVVIPMPGCAESLNVAAAAAICLFEKIRQESSGGDYLRER
ncbi:RNA methyltransferase, TrmH family [Nitrosomonas eutropha]|uniref:RNA methyltransferase, TrmH family n=1 Tax=Nitrosomonas eutropha TaxID=916 RepID=A0A1I7GLZ2_9PROT|nr:RNA methyltransferase [Nitrosomonas eutropha]SFU49276.1 RNA methyltransferase, TrmH family [Nitrosomonas eutropha]